MSISHPGLVRLTSAFLLIGFFALISIVAMNFWLNERAQSYFADVVSARDARVAAVELRNALQTAEASERGFLISGNEIYLGPYQSAKGLTQRYLTNLQTLLKPYPASATGFNSLSDILASKFEEFDRIIALKRDQKDHDALALFGTNAGKALTDEANVFLSGVIGSADNRLTSGVAQQSTNAGWVRLVSGLGALVIVWVICGAAVAIARYTKELRKTRDEVTAANEELERRVDARTTDLAQARDRAEVLLSEVNHRIANSLALVSSMVTLQSRSLDDPSAKAALAETQDRIFAISLVHKRLYEAADVRTVALDEYLTSLLDHLRTSLRSQQHGVSLSYQIEPVELDTDSTINLGVIITELVTNAFKYAYPNGVGEVAVRLGKFGGQIDLAVEDHGIGRAEGAPARGTGVGTRIVNAMCSSLGTQIEYRHLNPGTGAHLLFFPRPPRINVA